MTETTVYHGTTTENAQNILEKNFTIPKRKKYNYWLGRGVYFFLEDIFAFKWCIHEYKRIYKKEFSIDEASTMSIVEATLEYDEKRLLDLTLFKGQSLLDKVYNEILKNKKYANELKKYPKDRVCIVIEYMFEILGFNKYYDVVKQLYRVNIPNYSKLANAREQGVPQYQLCVKNTKIIKKRVIFDYIGNINNYIKQWNDLINAEPLFGFNIVQENDVANETIQYNQNEENILYYRGDNNE